jgi:nickel superoxide dismutase
MKRFYPLILSLVTASFLLPRVILSHCQVPCGIYDDEMRFKMMEEHVTTIEKSINKIVELSKEEKKDFNQIVRWVNNKDTHADEFTHIATYYFMAQRLKPVDKSDPKQYGAYIKKLELLQQMVFYAMKTKQTVDLDNTRKMRSLLAEFRTAYYGKA